MTDTAARWKATVHVGGLAPFVTAQIVHDAFLPFGEIVDVSMPKSDIRKKAEGEAATAGAVGMTREAETAGAAGTAEAVSHRGFAYVEFQDQEDAKEAIDNMDMSELSGRILRVSPAKPPKSASEGLHSKTAVWEQEGWLAEHAVSEDDRLATDQAKAAAETTAPDPMQGLEGLDVAGPKPA